MMRRRDVLKMGAAAGVAALVPGALARAQATPHAFKVGSLEVTVISDGSMTLPLSFLLPSLDAKSIDGVLAGRGLQAGAISAQLNVVVVRSADRLVLIDTGGTKDFMPTIGDFADRLEVAGFKPDDVTDVIFTHAHPDHLWGAVDALDEPRFGKARHHLSVVERDFWLKEGIAESMPEGLRGMAAGSQRRLKLIEARLNGARTGVELLPGLSLVDTPGHTPGHASVLLSSGSDQLLIGGDALSNAVISFERPDWVWGADFDPARGIATRKTLLDRLANERMPLLGYHLPWPGLGRVERKDGAFRFVTG